MSAAARLCEEDVELGQLPPSPAEPALLVGHRSRPGGAKRPLELDALRREARDVTFQFVGIDSIEKHGSPLSGRRATRCCSPRGRGSRTGAQRRGARPAADAREKGTSGAGARLERASPGGYPGVGATPTTPPQCGGTRLSERRTSRASCRGGEAPMTMREGPGNDTRPIKLLRTTSRVSSSRAPSS